MFGLGGFGFILECFVWFLFHLLLFFQPGMSGTEADWPFFLRVLSCYKALSVASGSIYAALQNILAVECKYESCMARMQLTMQ